MTNLFSTAAVLTDVHFGHKSDSPQFNQDCLEYLEWFAEQARAHQADRVIMIGDWFHNRSRIRLDTQHFADQGMEILREIAPVELVVGNHDMFHQHNRNVHSLQPYTRWDGIRVHNDHQVVDGVGFCPYPVGPEYLEIRDLEAEYVFGHFELPHFLLNSSIEMPDRGGMSMNDFTNPNIVFSGHFHKRQLKHNMHKIPVHYVGSPFGHDFNDVDDPERGAMILEWGGEPNFINYPDGPLYQRFTASQIVEMIENGTLAENTRPKSILEVKDDVGLELEDISMVREEALNHVREIRVSQGTMTPGMEMDTEVADMDNKPLDQIVEEHLLQIDPHGSDIEPETLARLYKGE